MNPPIPAPLWQLAADPAGRAAFAFASGAGVAQHDPWGGPELDADRPTIPTPSQSLRSGPVVRPPFSRAAGLRPGADRRQIADRARHPAQTRAICFPSPWPALDSRPITNPVGGRSSCANFPPSSPFSPRPPLPAAFRPMGRALWPVRQPVPSSPTRPTPTSSRARRLAVLRAPSATTRASAAKAHPLFATPLTGGAAQFTDATGARRPGGISFFDHTIRHHERGRGRPSLRPEGRD